MIIIRTTTLLLFFLLAGMQLPAQTHGKTTATPKLLSDYIDLRKPGDTAINYYYGHDNGLIKEDSVLLRSITDAILSEKINAYYDSNFTKKITRKYIEDWIKANSVAEDTSYHYNTKENRPYGKIVNADFNFFRLYRYELTGYKKYNAATKKNEIIIEGIAPAYEYTYNTEEDTSNITLARVPIFWMRYNDFKVLLNKYNADLPGNTFASELKKIDFTPVIVEYYDDNGKYVGHFKNGKYNGRGSHYSSEGEIYKGVWKDGNMNGKGAIYLVNGEKYIGDFKDDNQDGKGTYYFNNGDKYVGTFKENKISGSGIFYWENGDKYEGEWKDDKQSGKGTFTWANGDKQEGTWKDNEASGYGVLIGDNGDKYEGNWLEDKKWGHGIYYYGKVEKYDGEWKEDQKWGHGIYYYESGNKYEGMWDSGMQSGHGTFTWADGDKHEGDWKDDMPEGYGVYEVGNKSEGEIIYCPKCVVYKGYWKNGLKNGTGICFDKNGNKIYEGMFVDDKPTDPPYPNN